MCNIKFHWQYFIEIMNERQAKSLCFFLLSSFFICRFVLFCFIFHFHLSHPKYKKKNTKISYQYHLSFFLWLTHQSVNVWLCVCVSNKLYSIPSILILFILGFFFRFLFILSSVILSIYLLFFYFLCPSIGRWW